ncbi:50S ribosomal protein L32 [Nocardia yamanashiensis]|uniref:50S ribosomal protein L32 n=1 Tax=Nocardia yamanashiensis TaxID=209247 RepID=UPI001E40068D|nr:50S ribosomal protein L32 [Nocardia yamanashiensis]UGT39011.1 50S ribosomal protein L32 [Nocardia yamanashiensis]
MAVPKRRMSRSNTHSRRSQWKAAPVDLIPVKVNGVVHQVPRKLARAVERGLIDLDKL